MTYAYKSSPEVTQCLTVSQNTTAIRVENGNSEWYEKAVTLGLVGEELDLLEYPVRQKVSGKVLFLCLGMGNTRIGPLRYSRNPMVELCLVPSCVR
jgi:hypothetical protein